MDDSPVTGGDTQAPLGKIAVISLLIGRHLLEWGANARTVHQAIRDAACGLGCNQAEIYCQHSAIMVMLRRGEDSCMQMGHTGEHGIDLRRAEALLALVEEISTGRWSWQKALEELHALPSRAHNYPVGIVCVATGLACAAFGALLGAEPLAMVAIFIGAALGQFIRAQLRKRAANNFLTVTVVSFAAATIAGLVGRLIGAGNPDLTMVAAVLLLVPGPAILNAQVDAIDGRPNLAAARALRVVLILLFMTLGFFVAQHAIHL